MKAGSGSGNTVSAWTNKTHVGDCRALLREMAADGVRVQTCVTSPPYFGLRDYDTGRWEGGDPACGHGVRRWEGEKQTQGAQSGHASAADRLARTECACGARRIDSQIGLESSPVEYVAALVDVFRAVREVLAEDGTVWLNLGDSYAGKGGGMQGKNGQRANRRFTAEHLPDKCASMGKNLLGIPWRVAFALQDDGWYLRSDIIWHKPNPMPESVTDRPTKAHEYLFLFAKSPTYYYDGDAIREPSLRAGETGCVSGPKTAARALAVGRRPSGNEVAGVGRIPVPDMRNRRSVWTIASQPFSGSHFACFPRGLIEPCILAGSPPGGTVLDPFIGSGTTAQVATDLGRNFIGCELNGRYVEELHPMRATTVGMPL